MFRKEYAPHSSKIGATTTASAANFDQNDGVPTAYELYIKTPRSIIVSVPEKLASVLSP